MRETMTPMKTNRTLLSIALAGGLAFASAACAQDAPRARDLGIPLEGETGPLNAITDVAGIEVGHLTLHEGDAHTGVTTIFPRGRAATDGVAAGVFSFNGTGEMTGTHLIDEFGAFFGPIAITGTLGVGAARDGILQWTAQNFDDPTVRFSRVLPVVAETYDGGLSDVWSLPLTPEHVVEALDAARSGPVAEGAVGGGTGMVCYYFKCGIGTSSRLVRYGEDIAFTVGVLVQANHGVRDQLRIAGTPAGREIADLMPRRANQADAAGEGDGSIIIVIATDAPLLPDQLRRLARRATIGMGRTGGQGDSSSGDIFIAFTTANPVTLGAGAPLDYQSIPGEALDPLFDGVVQATEEAILNALVAGEDTTGRGNSHVYGLPHDRVRDILARYGRLDD